MGGRKRSSQEQSEDSADASAESEEVAEPTLRETSATPQSSSVQGTCVDVQPSHRRKTFGSTEAFAEFFNDYCRRTHQIFSKRSSIPREARNKKNRENYARKGLGPPEDIMLIDDKFPHYAVYYTCTHAGTPRARNSGKRSRQNIRPIGCNAKMNVLLQREGDRHFLVVSNHETVRVKNANLKDEDELALLCFARDGELEDVCLDAVLEAICKEVNTASNTTPTTTFSSQLMAMDRDEKLASVQQDAALTNVEGNIVGAVWVDQNHWCALCISNKNWTYTIMDPRNDKVSIEKVESLFRDVFHPCLSQDKRWKRRISREYQQMDGSSCGIWVLTFIESYLFKTYDAPGDVEYLRYRYLLKVLLA